MKVLVILSVMLVVATSYPTVKTMTLSELSRAIETKADPVNQPYYEDALNQVMENLFNGNDNFSRKLFLSPSGSETWTIEELTHELKAIEDPATNEDYRTAVIQAHGIYKQKEAMGITDNIIQVGIPAMDISTWTKDDLDTAMGDKNTKPELISHLEKAITEITNPDGDLVKDTIGMVTPVGLIPHEPYF